MSMQQLITSEVKATLPTIEKPVSTLDLCYVIAARLQMTATVGLAIDLIQSLDVLREMGTVARTVEINTLGNEVSYWSMKK